MTEVVANNPVTADMVAEMIQEIEVEKEYLMNLQPLFETQKILDQRIVEQHGLQGQYLLLQKVLALQVELGELANEWRGFKFWSKNQKPNLYKEEIDLENDRFRSFNPLLEEYVDCQHFILSIGNDLGFDARGYTPNEEFVESIKSLGVEKLLIGLLSKPIELVSVIYEKSNRLSVYKEIVVGFIGLGELLGFSWQQIEDAYYLKNRENHTRQATGY